uniref:Uncharacterized protein n=1 Tax=Caenorhabditis japonica TaxID=281687 RepID=A0A8R1EI57_CAEJA
TIGDHHNIETSAATTIIHITIQHHYRGSKRHTMNDEDGSEDDDDDDDNVRHGQSPRIATERTKRYRDVRRAFYGPPNH